MLIIEIKGIGGTSKNSDCSQINTIKHRRAEQRGSFDVSALYLVNHQRYLPPKNRRNPPFNEQQINDAANEKRGLLTTYDLFKLNSNIEAGFVKKEDARAALLQHGLVTFTPSDADYLGLPQEIHHNGTVAILKIEDIYLYQGAKIIVCNDGVYSEIEILEIKIDGQTVEIAENGEIGIKFNRSISRKSELWIAKK